MQGSSSFKFEFLDVCSVLLRTCYGYVSKRAMAEQGMGQMGHENRMGHESLGVDP